MLLKRKNFPLNLVLIMLLCISGLFASLYYKEATVSALHWFVFFSVWIVIFATAPQVSEDPFSPLWILVAYLTVYFFIRPFYFLLADQTGFLFELGNTQVKPYFFFLSSLLLICTYLPFLLGYSSFDKWVSKVSGRVPAFGVAIDKTIVHIIAIAVLITAVIAYFYVVNKLGGISNALSKQAALVKEIPELGVSAKLAWVLFNLYPLGIILLLVAKGQTKFWYFATFLGIVLCLILGRRTPLLAMLIPLLIFRHQYIKRISLKFAALMGGGLFAIFISIVAYRIFTTATGADKTILTIFASAEYFVWDMNLSILNDFGETRSYRLGLDFLPYWLRDFLSIDQYHTSFLSVGEATVDLYFSGFPAGIPAGMQGTLFMNFGWVGLIVGMFFVGMLARIFFEYMQINKESRLVTLLIYPVGLLAFFYILRLGDFWLGFSTQIRFFVMAILLALTSNHFRLVWKKRHA